EPVARLGFAQATTAPTPIEIGPPSGSPGNGGSSCGCQGSSTQSNWQNSQLHERLKQSTETLMRPFVTCLNNKGLGCCATHNDFGCTSLYAQCTFIFGSCRQFYNERCVQPPYGNPCGAAVGCQR